jgi:hypothetical protein
MKHKRILGALVLLVIFLMVLATILIWVVPDVDVRLVHGKCAPCSGITALEIAHDIGRLDVVSLGLVFLGIIVGFFAFFSLYEIRENAARIAVDTSKAVTLETVKGFFDDEKDNFMQAVVKEMVERTNTTLHDLPPTTGAQEQKPEVKKTAKKAGTTKKGGNP